MFSAELQRSEIVLKIHVLMCGDTKICVKDEGWEGVDWMHLADERNTMRNFGVQ
jgi:hypothetical protein